MSSRRPPAERVQAAAAVGQPLSQAEALDVHNLRAALNAHASNTAALSVQGYYDVSDYSKAVSRHSQEDADVAALVGVLEMIHPEFHPDPEWSDDEISGWLSDLSGKLKKGLDSAKKLSKDGYKKFRDNTKGPKLTRVTGVKIQLPIPVADLYSRGLAFPMDESQLNLNRNFMPAFQMINSYSGATVDSSSDFAAEVKKLGMKYGPLSIKLTMAMEAGQSVLSTIGAGAKGYVISGKMSSANGKLAETPFTDTIFILRDPKDDGHWKITRMEHGASIKV
jgi:hypothetical protein